MMHGSTRFLLPQRKLFASTRGLHLRGLHIATRRLRLGSQFCIFLHESTVMLAAARRRQARHGEGRAICLLEPRLRRHFAGSLCRLHRHFAFAMQSRHF
eukprot:scaffold60817_cov30-Tisochrysis_lutea.AAC.3